MKILSPRKINLPPLSIMLSTQGSFDFTDPIHGVTMTKSITTLSMGQMGPNNPTVGFPNRPTEEQLRVFGGMQALMKSCVDNAEDIKERIHRIVLSRIIPNSEDERVGLMKMDLMALKQWFMNDVRSSKIYQGFSEFNSTKKLKSFSKAFNSFILDRNKYTHGRLCFNSPSFDYILEYIETPVQEKRYAHLDIEILKSYNACYKEILKVITEYNVAYQNKRTTK
ncbi:MAG: hypothetical protein IPJ83_16515 [Saprospiraceae bacterium]|nr:hypothetical protein [Candidatus Vicinibacter proximus]